LAHEAGFLAQLAPGGFGRIVIPLVANQPGRPVDDARADWMAKLLREDQLSVGGAGDYGYRLFRLLSFDELPAPSLQDEHVLPFENYFRGHGSALYPERGRWVVGSEGSRVAQRSANIERVRFATGDASLPP